MSEAIRKLIEELYEISSGISCTNDALTVVADKLDKVADGYAAGGHSHKAQMLHALAEETRATSPTSIQLSAEKRELEVRKEELMGIHKGCVNCEEWDGKFCEIHPRLLELDAAISKVTAAIEAEK